jgi:hypothetical protein
VRRLYSHPGGQGVSYKDIQSPRTFHTRIYIAPDVSHKDIQSPRTLPTRIYILVELSIVLALGDCVG